MGLVLGADGGAALLDGFHGILHLVQPPLGGPRRDVIVVLVPEHCERERVAAGGRWTAGQRDHCYS